MKYAINLIGDDEWSGKKYLLLFIIIIKNNINDLFCYSFICTALY